MLKRFTHYLLFFVLLVFSSLIGKGQDQIDFVHLTSEEGLSENDVNCIYQDVMGFVWFGTHDGLNRFDGIDFKVFKPDGENPYSIHSNLIQKLTGDEAGNIWVGTTNLGIEFYSRKTNRFFSLRHDSKDPNSLAGNIIVNVFIDSKDRLFVSTKKGISVLENASKFDPFESDTTKLEQSVFNNQSIIGIPKNEQITSFAEDHDGRIWLGATKGLFELIDLGGGAFSVKNWGEKLNIAKAVVSQVAVDKVGNLVLLTNYGIYNCRLKDENEGSWSKKLSQQYFTGISIDKENNYWLTNGQDVIKMSWTGKELPEQKVHSYDKYAVESIKNNPIYSMIVDHMGIVWMGTSGGGVTYFDPNRKKFRKYNQTSDPHSITNNKIRSMFEDSHFELWVGTQGGGLHHAVPFPDSTKSIYQNFEIIPKIKTPFTIQEIKNNDKKFIVVGSEDFPSLSFINISNKIFGKQKDIKRFNFIKSSILSIQEDYKKRIWCGTYGLGVYILQPKEGLLQFDTLRIKHDELQPNSLASNIIRVVYQDSRGGMWIGTADGLTHIKDIEDIEKPLAMTTYKNDPSNNNGLSFNYILDIYESSKGSLWIATFGGGLNKYEFPSAGESEGKFTVYTEKDGLANNVVKSILEDQNGHIWLSTNKGISKYNPYTNTFQNYDTGDGLQSDEFQESAKLKRKNGDLLFGGINGFNVFQANEIFNNRYEPETIITGFSLFNKPIAINQVINDRVLIKTNYESIKQINLFHSENSFSVKFAGIHYSSPKKNSYKYKLVGFDEDWIYTDAMRREATYTNIGPGTYKLQIVASNNDGLWDSTPAEITIKISPPWYATYPALIAYLFLFILLLYFFRRFTIIDVQEKHSLIVDHMEKSKLEELQQLKLEFFTNISHEFRTPLTLINGPLQLLINQNKALSSEQRMIQYEMIGKNTKYLLRLVNELMDFRKINEQKMSLKVHRGDLLTFIKEIAAPFIFLAKKNKIKFEIVAKEKEIFAWFDPKVIEKIMNNLLSNAFKWTPIQGDIKIEIIKGVIWKKQNKNFKVTEGISSLEIRVTDSGPGIPKDKIRQVFDRFYVNKNKYMMGSGIGLAFAKSLVQLHKGYIKVDSEPNQGSTFIVNIPIDESTYTQEQKLNEFDLQTQIKKIEEDLTTESGELDPIQLDEIHEKAILKEKNDVLNSEDGKQKILVVDDNVDIRALIKSVLAESFEIFEASDGVIGLDVISKQKIDLIISDVMMPNMDGKEFVEHLKKEQLTSHIPIILLTAKSSTASTIEGLKLGADEYLTKPFDMEVLQLKINKILDFRKELKQKFKKTITVEPSEITVTSTDELFIQRVLEIVEDHIMDSDFSVEQLVKEIGLSRSNLYLKLKELTGLSSSEFIRSIRLKRAVQLLKQSNHSIKEIMYMTGFNTASYFSKCFKKEFGMVPTEYINSLKSSKNDADSAL